MSEPESDKWRKPLFYEGTSDEVHVGDVVKQLPSWEDQPMMGIIHGVWDHNEPIVRFGNEPGFSIRYYDGELIGYPSHPGASIPFSLLSRATESKSIEMDA